MKRIVKALAPIMLMIAVTFAMGCKKDKADGDGTVNGHTYVDLGLPSGTLWAACNVGATTPEGYGDYFAWGETATKTTYNWSTYKYANGDYDQLTKYCIQSSYGYNGFTDYLTTLLPEDDAAMANWGSGWCVPDGYQWEELEYYTTGTWTTKNGVNGICFTANNGNSLFLPAAGYRWNDELNDVGLLGCCWLSELDEEDDAWTFGFNSDYYDGFSESRSFGLSVRAVCSAPQN